MNRNYFETIVGAIVVITAIVFFINARSTAGVDVATNSAYKLSAKFLRIDGIEIGSDVRIAGIKVGSVTDLTLDNNSYEAVLQITIADKYKIPEDSYIAVISSGLLGDKYIDIETGMAEQYLKDGEAFIYTRASVSIEHLLSKFLFKN
jgi:phospholipid/cholesterol/gamma-HCH transport system substrate-binding protein